MAEERKSPLILVADDDPELLALLCRILEAEQYNVCLISEGILIRNVVSRLKPDMLILDLLMPGFDGMQELAQIREYSDIPIIVLSGVDDRNVIYKTLLNGADDYITKPFNTRELLARIASKLRRNKERITL